MASVVAQDQRKDSLTRLREHYHGEINNLITSMLTNYSNILSSSAITTNGPRDVLRLNSRQSNLDIETSTANLITTAESLLKLITEMKHNIAVHDYPRIRAESDQYIRKCDQLTRETNQKVLDLVGDVDMAIEELSESLYVSQERAHSRTA